MTECNEDTSFQAATIACAFASINVLTSFQAATQAREAAFEYLTDQQRRLLVEKEKALVEATEAKQKDIEEAVADALAKQEAQIAAERDVMAQNAAAQKA